MGLPRPDAGTPVHDYLAQHWSRKVILNWPCPDHQRHTGDATAHISGDQERKAPTIFFSTTLLRPDSNCRTCPAAAGSLAQTPGQACVLMPPDAC